MEGEGSPSPASPESLIQNPFPQIQTDCLNRGPPASKEAFLQDEPEA
jgi:hypothetical protein